jgi:hypothetical protein
VEDYKSSQLFLDYTSATDDSISFYLKTSSEEDYDFLKFYIDGILQGQWTGDIPWRRAAFRVDAGAHEFKWAYVKDLAYAWGQDRAWIDFIVLPPPILPEVDPGPGDTICAGMHVALQGTAQQYDMIKWSTIGDGVFSNDTSLSSIYTPGTSDLIGGSVILRLTGYGAYGSTAKNKDIRIAPLPVASISLFPRDTLCAGQSVILTTDTAGISSYQWTPGNFTTPEITIDTSTTGGVGSYLVRLLVTNTFQCQNRDSAFVTFRDCTGMDEPVNAPVQIYPNPNDGRFFVEVNLLKPGPAGITLTNATGTVVFSDNWQVNTGRWSKQLDLATLPEGIYLLVLTYAEGREREMVKVVVKR